MSPTGKGGGIYCFEDVAADRLHRPARCLRLRQRGRHRWRRTLPVGLQPHLVLRRRPARHRRQPSPPRRRACSPKAGSLLRFYGSSQHPALISGNTATPVALPDYPYGSAVLIEGAGTRLELHDSWVTDNQGGYTIGAKDADAVVIDRTLGANCHDPVGARALRATKRDRYQEHQPDAARDLSRGERSPGVGRAGAPTAGRSRSRAAPSPATPPGARSTRGSSPSVPDRSASPTRPSSTT